MIFPLKFLPKIPYRRFFLFYVFAFHQHYTIWSNTLRIIHNPKILPFRTNFYLFWINTWLNYHVVLSTHYFCFTEFYAIEKVWRTIQSDSNFLIFVHGILVLEYLFFCCSQYFSFLKAGIFHFIQNHFTSTRSARYW